MTMLTTDGFGKGIASPHCFSNGVSEWRFLLPNSGPCPFGPTTEERWKDAHMHMDEHRMIMTTTFDMEVDKNDFTTGEVLFFYPCFSFWVDVLCRL